jgi:hypothetical protein
MEMTSAMSIVTDASRTGACRALSAPARRRRPGHTARDVRRGQADIGSARAMKSVRPSALILGFRASLKAPRA